MEREERFCEKGEKGNKMVSHGWRLEEDEGRLVTSGVRLVETGDEESKMG